MNLKSIVGTIAFAFASTAFAAQTDALGGAGMFTSNESIAGWKLYVQNLGTTASPNKVGNIKGEYDNDSNYVLAFWSDNKATKNWHLQASHSITLTKGYSYQILFDGYMYDDSYGSVYMGYLDANDNEYFGEEVSLGNSLKSEVYKHCDATDASAKFYISGGDVRGETYTGYGYGGGFSILKVQVMATPISCGSTAITTPSSPSVSPSSSSSPQLTGKRVGPVAAYGQLLAGAASGKGQIYGSCKGVSSGNEVVVQGMSLFWSMDKNHGSDLWTDDIVSGLVSKHNIQIIRAPMGVEGDWGNGNYFTNKSFYKQKMDAVVQSAIDNNIYMIIDYHAHCAETNTSGAVEFFTYMAQKWGAYDNVIFEIYNEPKHGECVDDFPWYDASEAKVYWKNALYPYANTVIAAIRKYSDNLIVMGTPYYDQYVDAITAKPLSDNNVAYAFHYYAGEDEYKHTIANQGKNAEATMNAGYSVFVSEWGNSAPSGNGGFTASYSSNWYSWMVKHKLSGANWSVSTKDETASYFDGKPWSYTESGDWVNTNIFAKLPKSYTACAGTSKPNIPETPEPTSSSSVKPNSSSSGTSAPIVAVWESNNTNLEVNSRKLLVFGKLKGDDYREAFMELSLKKGSEYEITFSAKTEEDMQMIYRVSNANGDKLCGEKVDLTEDFKRYGCKFKANSGETTVSIKVSKESGKVYVEGFDIQGDISAIKKLNPAKNYNIVRNGSFLQVSSIANKAFKAEIFDLMGNVIVSKASAASVNVPLQGIASGKYILRISGRGGVFAMPLNLE